jgi:NAD(P)-dependent dehydrogenase (short-subunit alcohol dehydrogenase family)
MNPTYTFENKVALITGAASGLGLATARAFAQAGAAVVLADVNTDAVKTAAEELTSASHQSIGATYGRLDMAFNNAGVQAPPSDAADEPAENFDRVNAVNLRGV